MFLKQGNRIVRVDMNRKPRFKVIKKRSRMSAIINGNSSYAKRYTQGTPVYAEEGTHGIFVFRRKKYAQEWADQWSKDIGLYGKGKALIIVPVIPIGRGKKLVIICSEIESDYLKYYYKEERNRTKWGMYSEAPDDTWGYPGVYVLE